ncbi:unnamed protein product [Brassica napus]|uniref:(rape) hypothetical protein n=1 Tax=Brassica napus TaxID=3708 RepID=A0A816IAY1_BRANA|nr:unnamed protein product [Brassica napus]
MLVAREEGYAFHIDGKIYVMEEDRKDDNWMEVLDIKTQTWSRLLGHGATEFRDDWFLVNVFRGQIYVIAATENFAYDPKEGTWEVVETHECYGHIDSWCEIEDVMFCFTNSGHCMWYDTESGEWREVKGSDMEVLRDTSEHSLAWGCVVEIVNHGGKLLVIWVPRYKTKQTRRIWCGKIALEKRHEGEIWGKMEWVNEVLTVTNSFNFLSCVLIMI